MGQEVVATYMNGARLYAVIQSSASYANSSQTVSVIGVSWVKSVAHAYVI